MSAIRREGREIKRLRLLIPTFTCIPGCSDCCGPVPFSHWEWEKISDQRKATCLDCPYDGEAGCEIYEDRPIMCRLFGTVDHPQLRCPHGRGPEKMLTAQEGAAIADQYAKLVGGYRNDELVEHLRAGHGGSDASGSR